MKIFVTGVCGQLGFDVVRELESRGHEATGSDLSGGIRLDITDKAAVMKTVTELSPDAVIHCAGWTAVDDAEKEENRAKVFAVNEEGTRNLAEACKAAGCKMIYISTDYVFSGEGDKPLDPDSSVFAPLNVYGRSKLGGETAVRETLSEYYIVRISWLFGANGKNFVRTMLNVGKKYPEVRVVNDQIGTPTYSADLARLLADMAETDRYGCYHVSNEGGYISWYDFTCEIFRQAGYRTKVRSVTTAEYGLSLAARPFNSRLDKSKLAENGFKPLPDWRDALARYLEEINYGTDNS